MKRRDALRVLGAGMALPVLGQISAEELSALGTRIRAGATLKPVTGQLTYLNAHQNATVTAIADLIIPRTDTAGAADVGVNEFIDLIVGNWYSSRDRGDFMVGLMELDEAAQARAGRNFVDLPEETQIAMLTEMEAASFAAKEAQEAAEAEARGPGPFEYPTEDQPEARTVGTPPRTPSDSDEKPWNRHFFQRMKYLTLYGYYTSQEGMVEELHFRIVPGEYLGCVPVEDVHGHPTDTTTGPPPAGEAAPPDTSGVGRTNHA